MSEHPPVYNAVPTSEGNADQPPSYFNIMSQLRDAKNNSTGPADTIKSTLGVLCGSSIFGFCLLLSSVIPVSQLVIGLIKQDKCTIQPWIPMWLIVAGVVGIVYTFLRSIYTVIDYISKKKNPGHVNKSGLLLNCVIQLLGLFSFSWFIVGNYFVYSIFSETQYDPLVNPGTYCDKLVYLFAFWSVTATWILIGLGCFCCCGILCCTLGFVACLD